jgi:hypothetical protein
MLQVFGSAAKPNVPLLLEPRTWEKLLHSNGSVTDVVVECGDHGAERSIVVKLNAGPHGISGTTLSYECGPDGRGELLSSKPF